jgi:hypothetical protein
MGLFDKPAPKVSPSPAPSVARPAEDPARTTELHKMAGTSSLAEVAATAPANASAVTEASRARGRARVTATREPVKTPEQIAKEQQQQKAMEIVGKDIMSTIAALPYDTWAFMAADEEMKLTPEEAKELADAYYLLAQTANPDFSKPVWLIGALLFKNVGLVGKRMKIQAAKEKRKKELATGKTPAPEAERKPS